MIRFWKDSRAANARGGALGPLETAVMEILWAHGDVSVRDVAAKITRPLAYTTVMTTLDRLYKKGFLNRRKSERAFFYSPRWSRREWVEKQAGDFVAGVLADSQAPGELLISCLVDAVGRQDSALLDDLERKIRSKRKELEGQRQK
jgi:predicted transcriptional regulator